MPIQITGELPAGQYYVGDPCYAIPEDEWSAFLDRYWQNDENPDTRIFEYKGHVCFVTSTNTGDGCYRDRKGNTYPVDAGLIAALPIELIGHEAGEQFPNSFKVGATPGRWNKGGKYIKIGHVTIRT